MDARRLLPLLLLTACEAAKPEDFNHDDTGGAPSDTDTPDPGETGPITGLASRIHHEIGTLV